tara:strand:- start:494 stop:1768 length:1275 start_codon:yes stop_codon:yes gene_type:complete
MKVLRKKSRKPHQLILVILCVVFLTACTKPLKHFQSQLPNSYTEKSAPGLQHTLDKHKRLNLLLIHGMGYYSNSDDKTVPDQIAKSLRMDMTTKHEVDFWDWYLHPDYGLLVAGYIRRVSYKSADGSKTVTAYSLYWQSAVRIDKDELESTDKQKWIEDLRESKFYNIAKHDLLNRKVADAFLYTGKRQKIIDLIFNWALERIEQDSLSNSRHANAVISFSLGSAITAKNLALASVSHDQTNFGKNICQIYFMANQIPLLSMGFENAHLGAQYSTYFTKNLTIDDELPEKVKKSLKGSVKGKTTTTSPDSSKITYLALADLRYTGKKMPRATPSTIVPSNCENDPGPWILSFSDPNDLLSYPIDETVMENRENTFMDFGISIADKAYKIPLVKGLWVANPIDAHTGYGSKPSVLDIMVNGYTHE